MERTIAYTKNGMMVGTANAALPLEEHMYPAVGMRYPGDSVVVMRPPVL